MRITAQEAWTERDVRHRAGHAGLVPRARGRGGLRRPGQRIRQPGVGGVRAHEHLPPGKRDEQHGAARHRAGGEEGLPEDRGPAHGGHRHHRQGGARLRGRAAGRGHRGAQDHRGGGEGDIPPLVPRPVAQEEEAEDRERRTARSSRRRGRSRLRSSPSSHGSPRATRWRHRTS